MMAAQPVSTPPALARALWQVGARALGSDAQHACAATQLAPVAVVVAVVVGVVVAVWVAVGVVVAVWVAVAVAEVQ